MRKVLYVDVCIRETSRTQTLAQSLLEEAPDNVGIIHLKLDELNLEPLMNEAFLEREKLLEANDLNHERFRYAHQIANVDDIIIAAPFWDLSFPSLLKIYIENCAVDGITFTSTENGLQGLSQAKNLVYLTTRGGFYKDSPQEQGIPYLKYITTFFGIDHFHAIAADGMDVVGYDSESSLKKAQEEAKALGKKLFNQ